ncbi:MAG: hypothetical protein AAFO29_07090 [Actinomycetota bacterium]
MSDHTIPSTPSDSPPPPAPGHHVPVVTDSGSGDRIKTPGAFVALYRLVLRHQLTRGRLVLFGAIASVCVVLGWVFSRAGGDRLDATVATVSELGLKLIVPVVALVLGSAALGNWVDDETMVYVWLRPVARWRIALAALAASATVAVPVTAASIGIMALWGSGGDRGVLTGTIVSAALGGLAYVSIFVAAGLLIRRALLWGLVYVLIWEFFVARAGDGAARLSINSYAGSLLANYSEQEIRLADRAVSSSYIVLIGVSLVALAITTWRLQRSNVA